MTSMEIDAWKWVENCVKTTKAEADVECLNENSEEVGLIESAYL